MAYPLHSETEWDFHWADRVWIFEEFDSMHLEAFQRVNHYRNSREVSAAELRL